MHVGLARSVARGRMEPAAPRAVSSTEAGAESLIVGAHARPAPSRVDILSGISGVDFDAAWARRLMVTIDGRTLAVLSREDFVANKRAAGRPKDLLDLALLDEADSH